MKTFTGFASVIVVALALVGCGGGGDLGANGGADQVAKPSFALPGVISAVPPQQ
jgi:hypothetical protein